MLNLKALKVCNRLYYLISILLLIFLLTACKEKRPARVIDRSFYYWKSFFYLGDSERKALTDLHVNRLYVKFFDIAWNESKSEPMPVAVIKFPQNRLS